MQLASIESKQEQKYLEKTLLHESKLYMHKEKHDIHFIFIIGIDEPFWTSGMTVDNDRTFKWGNNKRIKYKNWNKGEPDNKGGTENCISINDITPSADYAAFTWNDIDCAREIYFICERVKKN